MFEVLNLTGVRQRISTYLSHSHDDAQAGSSYASPNDRILAATPEKTGMTGINRRKVLFSSSVVVAVLASLTTIPTAYADGHVTRHLITDHFTGQAIDSSVWFFGTNQADRVALSEGDGHVMINVSGAATNDFNAGLGTRCKASGDFDARLSFKLDAWPRFNGVWVSLLANDTNGFNTYRASVSWSTGDVYGSYLPPAGTTVPATGIRGTLRLVREGAAWASYYRVHTDWVAIASGAGPTSDTSISIAVFNISPATPFGGQNAMVEFDKFRLFADSIVCA